MTAATAWQADWSGLTPGDDWRLVIPIEGAAWAVGDAARSHVRVKPEATAITLQFSRAAGTIELNPGEIVLIAPSASTTSIAPGAYVYDIEVTRSGLVDTLVAGSMTVARDITR
jgi:hypothetical protein